MNFTEETEATEIQLDLKYCERCGGLWLRPKQTKGVYCAGCSAYLLAMPHRGEAPPRKPRRRQKVTRRPTVQVARPTNYLPIESTIPLALEARP
jgi:hypothetical protein